MLTETTDAYLYKVPHGIYRVVKPYFILEFRLHFTISENLVRLHSYKKVKDFENLDAIKSFLTTGN